VFITKALRRYITLKFRIYAITALALLSLMVLATPAYAASNVTFHLHKTTQTFPTTNPCTGVNGTLTITFNAVFHGTNDSSGGMHFTSTSTGVFTLAQVDGVTYTGHFRSWFGGNFNSGGTFVASGTFSAEGKGTDGSTVKFNSNMHITVNPDGTVTSSVSNFRCH